MAAMGFPMYSAMASGTGSGCLIPMVDLLRRLQPGQVKKLIENGMHLMTQAACMLCVLALCGRKQACAGTSWMRSLRSNSWEVPLDSSLEPDDEV